MSHALSPPNLSHKLTWKRGDLQDRPVIPAASYHLRDLILAEARSRGFDLDEYVFRLEQELPVLRFRLGPRVLWGGHMRLPGGPGRGGYAPDAITVHGSSLGPSKSWPRKRDGSFNIEAAASYLVKLIEKELLLPRPKLNIPSGVAAAESGLHVIHLAAVLLGVVAPDSRAEYLVERIKDVKIKDRIQGHLRGKGLADGDMRTLCSGVGLYMSRSFTFECDPFEPIGPGYFSIFKTEKIVTEKVESKFVLLLEHRGDKLGLADPAGNGFITVTLRELHEACRPRGRRRIPWVGDIGKWRSGDDL